MDLQTIKERIAVIESKRESLVELLEKPDTISLTRENVLPLFIKNAVNELRQEFVSVE